MVLEQSECGRFTCKHYRHAADGIYLEHAKLEEIRVGLRLYEQGHYFECVPFAEVDFGPVTVSGGGSGGG